MKHRICGSRAAAVLAPALLLAAWLVIPRPASASTLSSAVIGMFPQDVGEFWYADLKTARKFPWFAQLRDQLMPEKFRQCEQFLSSAGLDPNTLVDEAAWGVINASGGGQDIVGVALGTFNPSSSEDRFKQQKLAMRDVHGYHVYAYNGGQSLGDFEFAFIDNNTIAFGHRSALEKLIDVRRGYAQSVFLNNKVYPLIDEMNGSGLVWAVLDQDDAHLGMRQLVPQASQFPQAAPLISRIRAMTVSFTADGGLDARFQTVCGSPDDANLLGAALQAAILYQRYQNAQKNPDMATLLDQASVKPSGDRLRVELSASQDQLLALIRDHAFVVKM